MADSTTQLLAERQAEVCRVFANPKRILILWFLKEHERSVGEIAQLVGASLQSTSQHLRVMKQANLLTSHRDGQTIYYRVSRDGVESRCQYLLESGPQTEVVP
jgi:DNA-binding transcriptional ArsR family regulator